MSNKQINVNISNNRKIVAIANNATDYPSIDLYLDDGSDFLLIGSVEESLEKGLRLLAYNDLRSDEFTHELPIQ